MLRLLVLPLNKSVSRCQKPVSHARYWMEWAYFNRDGGLGDAPSRAGGALVSDEADGLAFARPS